MIVAVCPGSYDPVTLGHLDIIVQASKLFDVVHVAVSKNVLKLPMFDLHTRKKLLEEVAKSSKLKNVQVDLLVGRNSLLADFCKLVKADAIVKGVRDARDFENEFAMSLLNYNLAQVETILLPAKSQNLHISSSYLKNVGINGGSVESMLPEAVCAQVTKEIEKRRNFEEL
ncbi:MAG: pantetheine-phosphate adenylyltransferase [Candidatus Ancillula trichonymphae]|nr:pantetheine-phosphate adenylyltransferase [Candidatus Ancillula trichonymphae]